MDDNKNQERIHITREEYRQIKKKKKVSMRGIRLVYTKLGLLYFSSVTLLMASI